MSPQCKGIKKDGGRCSKNAKDSGCCATHQDQADDDHGVRAVPHTSGTNSSSSSSSTNNNRGNSAAKNSSAAADDDEEDWCQGKCHTGMQCTQKPQQNGYCHLHKGQAASSSRRRRSSSSGSRKSNNMGKGAASNSSAIADDGGDKECFHGKCQTGKQCTKKAQHNGYCQLHQDQAASSSSSSVQTNNRGKSAARISGAAAAPNDDDKDCCQGKCQTEMQCTKIPQENGYCHLHGGQGASSSSSSSSRSSSKNNDRRAATGTSRSTVAVAAASIQESSARLRSDTKDDLEQEQYRPYRSIEVAGCNGSTADRSRKGSWLKDWNKCFGYDGDQKRIELK